MLLPLVLASSSPYRKDLMQRLGLPFISCNPNIDESLLPNEPPENATQRLSKEKSIAISKGYDNHLIVASDQLASHEGHVLGKPMSYKKALEQLLAVNGKSVHFFTSVTVLNTASMKLNTMTDETIVRFRVLSQEQIESYLQSEQPLDCAGSFKAEGLGITLFESIDSKDPTALIGLPLIALTTLLTQNGIALP